MEETKKEEPKYPYGINVVAQCFKEDEPFISFRGYKCIGGSRVEIDGKNNSLPVQVYALNTPYSESHGIRSGQIVSFQRAGEKSRTRVTVRYIAGGIMYGSNNNNYLLSKMSDIKVEDDLASLQVGSVVELSSGDIIWAYNKMFNGDKTQVTFNTHSAIPEAQITVNVEDIKIVGYQSINTGRDIISLKFNIGDVVYFEYSTPETIFSTYDYSRILTLKQQPRSGNGVYTFEYLDPKGIRTTVRIGYNYTQYLKLLSSYTEEQQKEFKRKDDEYRENRRKLTDPVYKKEQLEKQGKILLDIALDVHEEEYVDLLLHVDSNNLDIIVWYPDVIISNSDGDVHNIKDLYLRFRFEYLISEDKLKLKAVQGTRRSYTKNELASYYTHSHLDQHSLDNYGSFCLGETATADLVGNLMYKFDAMSFEGLLHLMNAYVKWESLEGGPYRKIRNMRNVGGNEIRNDYNRSIRDPHFKSLMENITSLSLTSSPIPNGNILQVEWTPELQQEIVSFFHDNSWTDYLAKRIVGREVYYNFNSVNRSDDEQRYLESRRRAERNNNVKFKGKTIPFTILDESQESAESKLEICVHPSYVQHIISELSAEINELILTE